MPKVSLFNRLFIAVVKRLGAFVHSIRDSYYRQKNSNKPRLLVFTDSRGYEVVAPWNRQSAYASYVGQLCKEYHVEHVICPEFSTTVIDFLYEYQQRLNAGKQYDVVIAHVGVVDFSPRPTTMLADMMQAKSGKIAALFPESEFDFEQYHQQAFADLYFGKPVKNFYSAHFLQQSVIPKLLEVENLILIGCSPVLTDWQGNYWRERPKNMEMILAYSALCQAKITHFVDYSAWTAEQIKTYTIDNIHLSQAGFDLTHKEIKRHLESMGY